MYANIIFAFFLILLASCEVGQNSSEQIISKRKITAPQDTSAIELENVDLILKQYDSPTRDYWQNPDLVVEKLGPLNGKIIADVGVGTGYFTFRLAPEVEKVIALDVENRFLEYIEDRKFELGDNEITRKIETRLCLPDDPLLKKEEVDIVLIVNTYHFIEDRLSYLKKINMGIRQNGEMILVDFKHGKMSVGPSESAKVPLIVALEEIKSAGFEIIELDTVGLQFQYIIKSRKINYVD